ncbi:MAG: DMT family transporter [Actinomycetota bacterium]|nr:DMT family transporter [Actinomycetota bacterium]
MLAVALALSASLCWGVADFAGGFFSRRLPALLVVLVLETGGLLGIALVLAVTREAPPELESVLLAAVAGLSGTGGLVCFFRGMALGSMAIVAPVFASGAAIVPVVVGLATGDTVTALVGAGLALAAVGILLASLESEHEAGRSRQARKALGFALVGALGAAGFVVASDAASDGSVAWTLFVARAAAIPFLVVGVGLIRARRPARSDLAAIGFFGLIDLAATACFGLAATRGALAVVAVLGAMYPVITAGLARVVLKERIRRIQLAGVAFALLGVALVAAG